ncbi:Gmad2 immunoglobulin-like domain-containing protein [Candidatus Parcubacteria bacterium]|nr:Gmad2 immunoglobulin-like domain-containing protein [Candidatus Parcubacteria bacterium]
MKMIGGIVVVLVVLVGAYLFLTNKVQAPVINGGTNSGSDNTGTVGTKDPSKDDLIVVTSVKANQKVSSPLTVQGKARGSWYFEASFPYELKDAEGHVLAQGPVEAQGDWMTAEYVPFTFIINYAPQPAGSKGTLVLHKDNPSGLPENENQLEIPITF